MQGKKRAIIDECCVLGVPDGHSGFRGTSLPSWLPASGGGLQLDIFEVPAALGFWKRPHKNRRHPFQCQGHLLPLLSAGKMCANSSVVCSPQLGSCCCVNTNLISFFLSLSLFLFWSFLGPHLRHTEVPKLGVESELQLPAYTTATAMPDP